MPPLRELERQLALERKSCLDLLPYQEQLLLSFDLSIRHFLHLSRSTTSLNSRCYFLSRIFVEIFPPLEAWEASIQKSGLWQSCLSSGQDITQSEPMRRLLAKAAYLDDPSVLRDLREKIDLDHPLLKNRLRYF